jgi:hypothetical protein
LKDQPLVVGRTSQDRQKRATGHMDVVAAEGAVAGAEPDPHGHVEDHWGEAARPSVLLDPDAWHGRGQLADNHSVSTDGDAQAMDNDAAAADGFDHEGIAG